MNTLGSMLDNLLKEAKAVKSVVTEKSLKKAQVKPGATGVDHTKQQTEKKLKADAKYDKYAMKTAPEVDQVIDKINILRSGHSISKNEEIRAKVEKYFNSLSKAEKVAMFVFLKSIGEILTIDLQPDKATDPSDVGLNVQRKGGNQKTVEPSVTRRNSEDTSAPVKVS